MKSLTPLKGPACWAVIVTLAVLCLDGQLVFAAGEEAGGGWRPMYDRIMLCVNFLILVFILVKFLKNPLKNFFKNQRQTIIDEIDRLEKEKAATESALLDMENRVTAGDAQVQAIRKRLASEGETIKQKIIENAKQQSEYMMAAARKNINNHFLEAKKTFQAELIDLAINEASGKLSSAIDTKDHQRLINQFLSDLAVTRS